MMNNTLRLLAVACAATFALSGCATRSPGTHATTTAEQHFGTPKEAVDALLTACRSDDEARLVAIFGEAARPIITTGDQTADHERCKKVLDAAQEMTRLDPKGPDTAQLVLGSDDWPFPIPLVKDGKGWRFDTAEGIQEIRRRRIGADELEAITACRVYVQAQELYARRVGGGKVYAQKLVSTPGKKDGLYWPSTGKGDVSPLGPVVAAGPENANGAYPHGAWRGYFFRILTAQGSDAPGGKRNYIAGGKMTGGFALIAYPVAYGSTGIMTFIVDRDGQVYQKDLGPQTDETVKTITAYDPDRTWSRVSG